MSGLNGHSSVNGTPLHTSVENPLAENTLAVNTVTDTEVSEHLRLEVEIAAAKARTVAARERAAALESEVQKDMRQELMASRETVAEMERNHVAALAMIRNAAQAEADRILEGARQHAASTRVVRNAG